MDLEANDQLEPSSQNLSTVIALRPTPMRYATPTRCAALHPTPYCVRVHSCNTTQKRGGAGTCHAPHVDAVGALAYVRDH